MVVADDEVEGVVVVPLMCVIQFGVHSSVVAGILLIIIVSTPVAGYVGCIKRCRRAFIVSEHSETA